MKFKNGKIVPEKGMSLHQLHDKIVKELYDSGIYVPKIIGFNIDNRSGRTQKQLDRNHSVLENMITLSNILSKIVFIPFKPLSLEGPKEFSMVRVDIPKRTRATTGNTKMLSQQMSVHAIDKELHLLTTIESVTLNLFVIDHVGYLPMEESSKLMTELLATMSKDPTSFFPMNVDFSLHDYIRILPPTGEKDYLEYRLFNGMTDELLNHIYGRGVLNA